MVPRAACRGFVLGSAAALGCVSCVHQVIHQPQFQGQPPAHVMARPPAVTPGMGREMGEGEGSLGIVHNYLAKYPGARDNWELLSLEDILEDEHGRFAPAETAHRAALGIEPGRSALHNNLGYNLLLQGEASAAAAEF